MANYNVKSRLAKYSADNQADFFDLVIKKDLQSAVLFSKIRKLSHREPFNVIIY
ncbi:TPA: hypothetical protein R4328_000344 [Pasteurella multocida]|uniref:Uncharacterized protein n=1 Tax=Pasteurella multocida TaxID=747 RepID=A0A9X3ZLD3_PASMD|nr:MULTISPECIES: hypothetical protein [Gammaproteobacteria]EGP05161.1 hypothetical protein GEW_08627 [Pasteurella multocida subsp. gallicida str. Anand1_poultry]AET16540.1 hypothetical protein Pmu_16670 [Pasteurella multocida 36950]AFF24902.1 hypothetical protein PMCN06_1674 [Pasteurella multocida subsp. multocida str. HN06]AFI46840.1 hypothetical protein NT08PM_1729 [Pasteurella multocida subsp. multocida str. 3480]AHE65038.1 hypothetical protein PMCN03_1605 [Pasteurella multocida subsp. mult